MSAERFQLANNTYWTLRHGRSLANEAGRIISRMENGIKPEWGLAEIGKGQATAAGEQLQQELGEAFDHSDFVVYASPFSRTMQTAKLASEQVTPAGGQLVEPQPTPELAERDFGSFELLDDSNYPGVWQQDAVDTSSKPTADGRGESVMEVADRLRRLMTRLEDQHKGRTILLVAHGDTISILGALCLDGDFQMHKARHYLNTGELRLLHAAS